MYTDKDAASLNVNLETSLMKSSLASQQSWHGRFEENNNSPSSAGNQNPVHPGHSLVVWRFRILISTRKPAIFMKYVFVF